MSSSVLNEYLMLKFLPAYSMTEEDEAESEGDEEGDEDDEEYSDDDSSSSSGSSSARSSHTKTPPKGQRGSIEGFMRRSSRTAMAARRLTKMGSQRRNQPSG